MSAQDHLLRHTTFRQFQVFEAIARLGSFTKAAEELFLTQPTVSMQVKKLSDTLGMPLFEHAGRRLYLTEAGRALQVTCTDLFQTMNRLEMTLADLQGLKQGRLRIAAITTAKYFAPRMLGDFCQLYPGVDLELQVINRQQVIERLSNNLDDLYILGQPPEELDVEAHAFLDNPLVPMAAAHHPLSGKRKIPLKRLLEEPFIMREVGSGTRKAAERLFEAHGLAPKVKLELGSNEAIKQAIASGLGVSVLSRHALSLLGEDGPISVLDVKGFPLRRKWYLVYPRGRTLSPVAQAFLQYLPAKSHELMETFSPESSH